LPPKQENGGYIPAIAIRGGFDRRRHYVALPSPQNGERSAREYDAVFFAAVRGENDWDDMGAFVRRYLRAFAAERSVMLAIAAFGEPDALTIGERIKRLAQREGIDLDTCADIDVCDTEDERDWQSSFSAKRTLAVTELEERSPSALRRILQENAR
ncbi:MAG TPA: hypothetical protein VFL13_15840, partial [Candidatus Baltobacteraceae bacterium]|nr:hypothetical protein [Candidatus Baltobacteraceae bacterium]